ncbi:pyridoxal phosphate-dependent transferase [Tuber indicum]|nr:pyridoxal phosphate-dependent transferase [Tuber indicum]
MDEASRPIYIVLQVTTPTDTIMLDAMLLIYTGLYGNPNSPTQAYCWETEKAIDVAREHVAKLIGVHPKEIIFTSGATESNNMPTKCVARLYKFKNHIISQTEQKRVLDSCRHLQDEGYDITYLRVKNNGSITLKHLEEIRPGTVLVSIMPANNEIAVIQPMEEIGKLCRKKGVFFQTDGVQAVGKIPVDVSKWNVDLMRISCPKICGPNGIGAFYIRRRQEARIDPLTPGGGQERGLGSGTPAHPLVTGFGEARRIARGEVVVLPPHPLLLVPFSLNPLSSSTLQDDNYIRRIYHTQQPKQFTRAFRTMGHHKADTKPSRHGAAAEDSRVRIREANLTSRLDGMFKFCYCTKAKVPNNEEDQKTDEYGGEFNWTTPYSEMTTHGEAREGMRLNLTLTLREIPVKHMLEGKSVLLGPDVILKVKKQVYRGLAGYVVAAGYPIEADPDFTKGNLKDIVLFTIHPIVAQFKIETTRNLRVVREKEIFSPGSTTAGMEEFVVMDLISFHHEKYVLIAEAKMLPLSEAREQCFLSMIKMRDLNGGGTVYGFITTGESWRMISFDGKFEVSEKIQLMFDTMDHDEKRWIADYSILIDCFNVALSNGAKGLVKIV